MTLLLQDAFSILIIHILNYLISQDKFIIISYEFQVILFTKEL